jgi:hypothetical protein
VAQEEGVTIDAENPPVEFDPRHARTAGKKFNPFQHFRKLGARGEYLDVKWRLVWLRSEFPDALIETKMLTHEYGDKDKSRNIAVFWARVTLPEGQGCAEAHGSETQNDFGDYYEKAETKAVGRALEYLGYGTTSAKEDQEALADSPVGERRGRDDRDRGRGRDYDRDDRGRDRGRDRDRRDDEEEDDRPRRDRDDRPQAVRRSRDEEDDPRPAKPAATAARRAAPPPDDTEEAIDTDVKKVFGFPAVEHEGVTYTGLLPVQKAMDDMPGKDAVKRHEGRQALYRAIIKARWPSPAVAEVKGFWVAANQRDEREDAAGAILDDEDDE